MAQSEKVRTAGRSRTARTLLGLLMESITLTTAHWTAEP